MSSGTFLASFSKEGVVRFASHPTYVWPFSPFLLFLQEVTAKPLDQISCICQESGFEISTEIYNMHTYIIRGTFAFNASYLYIRKLLHNFLWVVLKSIQRSCYFIPWTITAEQALTEGCKLMEGKRLNISRCLCNLLLSEVGSQHGCWEQSGHCRLTLVVNKGLLASSWWQLVKQLT